MGTRNFFWVRNRNFATWRKHFRNRNSATVKEMLLRNRNSAIAIFSDVRNFKSATWELNCRNFWPIFGRGIRSGSRKKLDVKKLVQLSLYGKFLVSRETDSSKNIFRWFLNSSWAEKKVPESSGMAGDCIELRNCGSQILKLRNRSSATFFSPQLRSRFGCPQYCGVADVRT